MEGDFRLGEWVVRRQLNTIENGGEVRTIEPKVMEVLAYLAQHAGEVIPKERILQAVWPDTFVSDEVLTYSISELRKAFDDDAKNPRFIQTIPRRGYRLIAPVRVDEARVGNLQASHDHTTDALDSAAGFSGAVPPGWD